MEYEHSEHVAASPDRVYGVLADAENLAHFVPQLTAVHRVDGNTIEVEARYDGQAHRGQAWLHTDPDRRRIEWGVKDSGYHGSFEVLPDGDGAKLALALTTVHDRDFERDVTGTLDAIRRLLESEV
jgi:ribosome-associated toxin RatA of RatAB toxin-antitoxin module